MIVSPATAYPPLTPKAFPRVATNRSAGGAPVNSSVPRPVAPNAPTPWESSTTTTTFSGKAESNLRANAMMRSSGA